MKKDSWGALSLPPALDTHPPRGTENKASQGL